LALSRDTQRQPKTPQGAWPREEAVKPQGTAGGPSVSPAQTEQASSGSSSAALLEQVLDRNNLRDALKRVEANAGAPGVDGMGTKDLRPYLKDQWERIRAELVSGTYEPQPVRRVEIPKPQGGKRLLGIPTVRDRIVQQAVVQVIGPIFEAIFCDCNNGYRPRRSTHTAIAQIRQYGEQGYRWVVDADIQDFFGALDHDLLMGFVREKIVDGSVLGLIRAWLKAGVMEDMKLKTVMTGSPQGGVISPLLANVYLHQFDRVMMERGYRLVRYADDHVILCKLDRKAERALEVAKQILEGQLKLKVHPEKTRHCPLPRRIRLPGVSISTGACNPKGQVLAEIQGPGQGTDGTPTGEEPETGPGRTDPGRSGVGTLPPSIQRAGSV
jgi:RNA-directed DNA polymerase